MKDNARRGPFLRGPKAAPFLIPAGFAVFFVVAPALCIEAGIIDPYIAQIITVAGVNAILAISVNFITGFAGQL